MESPRTEESLVTSLSELRAIELQRQADERAAIEAAWTAKRAEREAAEREARAIAEASLAAERAAQLAAEQARSDAERQVRLHAEAVLATERARHQAELEHARLREETALRREVAERQRPRWMIAVTGLALTTAVALAWVALDQHREALAARDAEALAVDARTRAEHAAHEAATELTRFSAELTTLDAAVRDAIRRVGLARDEAARQAAADALSALQRRQTGLAERQRQRDEERRKRERAAPVVITDECLNNVLCRPAGASR